MVFRQLVAACWRSSGFSSNWFSFSASAKVAIETGGPTSGDVPNAGGAPAGGTSAPDFCFASLQADAAAIRTDAPVRKSLRDFAIHIIVSCATIASCPNTASILVYPELTHPPTDGAKSPSHE